MGFLNGSNARSPLGIGADEACFMNVSAFDCAFFLALSWH
jgi:hypothetical protein